MQINVVISSENNNSWKEEAKNRKMQPKIVDKKK